MDGYNFGRTSPVLKNGEIYLFIQPPKLYHSGIYKELDLLGSLSGRRAYISPEDGEPLGINIPRFKMAAETKSPDFH